MYYLQDVTPGVVIGALEGETKTQDYKSSWHEEYSCAGIEKREQEWSLGLFSELFCLKKFEKEDAYPLEDSYNHWKNVIILYYAYRNHCY